MGRQVDVSARRARGLHRQNGFACAVWRGHLSRNRTDIECQPQGIVVVPAPHDQERVVSPFDFEAAESQRRMLSTQCEQRARERKGR